MDSPTPTLRLTERCKSGGGASKLGPGELAAVLAQLPPNEDPRVLVDYRTGDDAGIFRLDDRTLLVQTVDFFTPIVDDPETYGAIAAANALSDVYAMGGEPQVAVAVCGFPSDKLPRDILTRIFRGGRDKAAEAGCAIAGGHTMNDGELKY